MNTPANAAHTAACKDQFHESGAQAESVIGQATPGPWRTQGWVPCWAYIPVKDAHHNLVASLYPDAGHGYTREQVDANANLIAAAPDLAECVRAQHAWSYCEHFGLGTFQQRSVLCAHVDYLNAKSVAKLEGRTVEEKYKGARRMLIWPTVEIEESTADEANALIEQALQHERAAITKAEAQS